MRLLLSLLPLTFLLTACGDSASTTDNNAASVVAATSRSTGPDNCFGEKGTSLCDFLPRDVIARYVPGDFEMKGYKEMERRMTSTCGISVDHPTRTRVMNVGTMKMTIPEAYMVTLNMVTTSENAASRFASTYRTLTPEQAAAAEAAAQAEVDARVARGEVDESTAEAAAGLVKLGTNAKYFPLEGVGDRAVYGGVRVKAASETMESIFVLVGNTSFALEVDMIESREHSRQVAKEIAQGIIANCR